MADQDQYSDRTGLKGFEPRAQRAFDAQDVWVEYLEMLDGMVAEAMRHGWDEAGSRILVVTMIHNAAMGTHGSSETEPEE